MSIDLHHTIPTHYMLSLTDICWSVALRVGVSMICIIIMVLDLLPTAKHVSLETLYKSPMKLFSFLMNTCPESGLQIIYDTFSSCLLQRVTTLRLYWRQTDFSMPWRWTTLMYLPFLFFFILHFTSSHFIGFSLQEISNKKLKLYIQLYQIFKKENKSMEKWINLEDNPTLRSMLNQLQSSA